MASGFRKPGLADLDCLLLAGRYTLLEQGGVDGLLSECVKRDISIILGGVYNSGILATGVRKTDTPHYNYEPAPRKIIDRVAALE